MGSLDGRAAVVLGGAGNVGEEIARVLLREGATVAVPSRSVEKLARLRDFVGEGLAGRLLGIEADVGTEAGALAARDAVRDRLGEPVTVVASLGGWWQGRRVLDVPLELWNRLLHQNLTTHFLAARAFLPIVATGGAYTMIAGFSGEEAYPGAGPVSVAVAGQLMLKRVLAAELEQSPVRVNDLILGPVNTRARGPYARPEYLSGEDVGDLCARLASPAGAHLRGETFRLMDRRALAEAEARFRG